MGDPAGVIIKGEREGGERGGTGKKEGRKMTKRE